MEFLKSEKGDIVHELGSNNITIDPESLGFDTLMEVFSRIQILGEIKTAPIITPNSIFYNIANMRSIDYSMQPERIVRKICEDAIMFNNIKLLALVILCGYHLRDLLLAHSALNESAPHPLSIAASSLNLQMCQFIIKTACPFNDEIIKAAILNLEIKAFLFSKPMDQVNEVMLYLNSLYGLGI